MISQMNENLIKFMFLCEIMFVATFAVLIKKRKKQKKLRKNFKKEFLIKW